MTPERLRAIVRLLLYSGDLTPAGARILLRDLPEAEAESGGGIGDE